MKKIIGIIVVLAIGTSLAGCNHYKKKGHGKYSKGKHAQHLLGGRGSSTPNCGPGCRQRIR